MIAGPKGYDFSMGKPALTKRLHLGGLISSVLASDATGRVRATNLTSLFLA